MPSLDFNNLFYLSPIPSYVLQDGFFKLVNNRMIWASGYTEEELLKITYIDLIHPEDRSLVASFAIKRLAGHDIPEEYEFRALNRQGNTVYVKGYFSIINYEGRKAILGQVIDITIHKIAENSLKESNMVMKTLLEKTLNPIFVADHNCIYIDANPAALSFLECTKSELLGKKVCDYITRESQDYLKSNDFLEPRTIEMDYSNKGNIKTLLTSIVPLKVSGKNIIYSIGQDITERKILEGKLRYLSLHDSLTGLYNRAYFEQELRRFSGDRYTPIGMIISDVDSLKLVNDILGHGAGDTLLLEASKLLKNAFREGDMVARIGGDEIAILLPNTDTIAVESVCCRIKESIKDYNNMNTHLPLSISIGFAVSECGPVNMRELFKKADDNMYREKMRSRQESRSNILGTLMKSLETLDFIADGHGNRLYAMTKNMLSELGHFELSYDDLRLLAQFHDIGKVGVPEQILFKNGPLTPEEIIDARRHAEIGHRIAQLFPELTIIADLILKHHEWWNGQGYPMGIKGEEIPLECRVLAIADAFDTMTTDRPYRKAMSQSEAAAELKKQAGVQFDPHLVRVFIERLIKQKVVG